jgi:hypothetical protein
VASDVGFIIGNAGTDPAQVEQAVRDHSPADDVAMLYVPKLELPAPLPAIAFCAVAISDSTDRGLLRCDLTPLARALSKRSRTLAVFVAEHYGMGGYRMFESTLDGPEKVYWEDNSKTFPPGVDFYRVANEGLEAFLGTKIPDELAFGVWSFPLLARADDAAASTWTMLRREKRHLHPPEAVKDAPLLPGLTGGWTISFTATGGIRHVMRTIQYADKPKKKKKRK